MNYLHMVFVNCGTSQVTIISWYCYKNIDEIDQDFGNTQTPRNALVHT